MDVKTNFLNGILTEYVYIRRLMSYLSIVGGAIPSLESLSLFSRVPRSCRTVLTLEKTRVTFPTLDITRCNISHMYASQKESYAVYAVYAERIVCDVQNIAYSYPTALVPLCILYGVLHLVNDFGLVGRLSADSRRCS